MNLERDGDGHGMASPLRTSAGKAGDFRLAHALQVASHICFYALPSTAPLTSCLSWPLGICALPPWCSCGCSPTAPPHLPHLPTSHLHATACRLAASPHNTLLLLPRTFTYATHLLPFCTCTCRWRLFLPAPAHLPRLRTRRTPATHPPASLPHTHAFATPLRTARYTTAWRCHTRHFSTRALPAFITSALYLPSRTYAPPCLPLACTSPRTTTHCCTPTVPGFGVFDVAGQTPGVLAWHAYRSLVARTRFHRPRNA